MEPDSLKVIYHHFTGRYTEDKFPVPIFGHYPGYVRGPFKVIKPPTFKRVPGNPEPEVTGRGDLEYFPNQYFIMVPAGNKYVNLPREGWHLEVNVGTEFFPRMAYFENCNEKSHCRSPEASWFEFVKDEKPEPELAGAAGAGKTQQPSKGK